MNLKIDIQKDGQAYRIKLAGEIDAYTAPKLKEKFMEITEHTEPEIIVDLTDVSYMDSTGLGVFIASERIKRLFDITGLTDILNVNSQVEGGVK
jgi:anti-sigma B factor antagonist